MTTGINTHVIPQDVIHEILLLLSVKSLLRFKCVAKSWHALISSRRFVKAHLEKSSNDPSFRHQSIITSNDRVLHWSLITGSVVELDHPEYGGHKIPVVKPISSCNGLVCVKIPFNDFVLWNPSTRNIKILPSLPIEVLNDRYVYAWGFGYVESSDDYKVFALTRRRDPFDDLFSGISNVYSLKKGCWRIVDRHSKLQTLTRSAGKFLGGKLYWLQNVYEAEIRLRQEIVTFDLENEVFAAFVKVPDNLKGLCLLGVVDGHLSVLCGYPGKDFKVWVMKQDGLEAKPYWNKLLSSHELNLAIDYRQCHMVRNMRILRNLGVFRFVKVHVESLVSLSSDCEGEANSKGGEIWSGEDSDDGMIIE